MKQDIDKLLERYYEGETSLDEERQLRQFFQQESIPVHLQHHSAQFRYFADAHNEHPSLKFSTALASKLDPLTSNPFGILKNWSVRIAASIALLLIGFAGGLLYTHWRSADASTQLANSTASATPEVAIKKVLAFESNPKTSASERIQAINQSFELTQADRDITQLLINTLNFDPNVNVRLAACQALVRFENEPVVRNALIQSLQIQTDPNVQITLIDVLVAIKEKRAVTEIQRLAQNQQVLEAVRIKAAEGITRLDNTSHSPS
ncbi:HEAT repeat domain-containing protein [Spirosoma linguale]|uniref:HEAT repeat domain-containing protein n=1 Tax=Spirosoma linguale (strain ATCC 33905 / DSM 74 / LMG 10896 / Claus 1) TaxID=504472 RepID=D2QNG1_SPILD|nr:hypothetical protein Slin_3340 [Spirosoma linguale DSM 74]